MNPTAMILSGREMLDYLGLDDAADLVREAVEAGARLIGFAARIDVLREQITRIEAELRTTSQRVNLFEKVKIPECRETIRLIGIALGDEQTSAVARGKIAKSRDKSGESAPVAEEGAA